MRGGGASVVVRVASCIQADESGCPIVLFFRQSNAALAVAIVLGHHMLPQRTIPCWHPTRRAALKYFTASSPSRSAPVHTPKPAPELPAILRDVRKPKAIDKERQRLAATDRKSTRLNS